MKDEFWKEGIFFYLDASTSQHKYNPHDKARLTEVMAWQLSNEGLHLSCIKVAHFFVAIENQKGVFSWMMT